jgi:hypothetical protein
VCYSADGKRGLLFDVLQASYSVTDAASSVNQNIGVHDDHKRLSLSPFDGSRLSHPGGAIPQIRAITPHTDKGFFGQAWRLGYFARA